MINLYDFIFTWSSKEIKNYLRKNLGIFDSANIKLEYPEFLKQLDFVEDSRVTVRALFRNWGATYLYYALQIPGATYQIKGQLNFSGMECNVKMSVPKETIIIQEHLNLFEPGEDERNNIEVSAFHYKLAPELFNPFPTLKMDCTISQLNDKIQEYYIKVLPLFSEYVSALSDGTLENLWNKHNPGQHLQDGILKLDFNLFQAMRNKVPEAGMEDFVILGSSEERDKLVYDNQNDPRELLIKIKK